MTRSGYLGLVTAAATALLLLGALGIGAGSLEVAAVEQESQQVEVSGAKGKGGSTDSRSPTATLPTRYYVPHVQEAISVYNSFCSTAISIVIPFSPASITVSLEVEVFSDNGATMKLETWSGNFPGARWTVVTDSEIRPPFSLVDKDLNLDNFTGFATVNSNDPRLFVTAYDWCRTGTGATAELVSMNGIQVYPVGATLEFLKAGLPGGIQVPSMVAPRPDSSH